MKSRPRFSISVALHTRKRSLPSPLVVWPLLARDFSSDQSLTRIRLHGSKWKDDPSWHKPLNDTEKNDAMAALTDFIRSSKRLLVITGAGASTASGIPDYRGKEGSYKDGHKPMSHQEFVRAEENRQRYWARSLVGFGKYLAGVEPNRCHQALSLLEAAGRVQHLITQNVDGLHSKAGSVKVTDLHGRIDRVKCLGCGALETRPEVQKRMVAENAEWVKRWTSLSPSAPDGYGGGKEKAQRKKNEGIEQQRADGDAELSEGADYSSFRVPRCLRCGGGNRGEDEEGRSGGLAGGNLSSSTNSSTTSSTSNLSILKPDVVYFGDNVPKATVEHALQQVDASDAVLVVGTSLEVFSAYRFVLRACGSQEGKENTTTTLTSAAPATTAHRGADGGQQSLRPTKPLCILNLGETRAERSGVGPVLKIHLPCDEALWDAVVREGLASS